MRRSYQGIAMVFLGLTAVQAIPMWLEKFWFHPQSILERRRRIRIKLARGGESPQDHAESADSIESSVSESEEQVPLSSPTFEAESSDKRYRHSSDFILDLPRRASATGSDDESMALRQLITTRFQDYLVDFREAASDSSEGSTKLPPPLRLLHYLAPKVPAIKQSPDVNLRIHSARSDIDSGVAACIIATMAHVCEIYDKETTKQAREQNLEKPESIAADIISDRRFEQLVECVLSGVNVEKRKRESLKRRMEKDSEEPTDIEEILDGEDLEESDGLTTTDACRAAWGITVLGAHHLDTLGGQKVLDLLMALSLRVRELLLARLQLLRQEDLLSEPSLANMRTEDRLNQLADELAEDAASAMWTFACVRACTGLRSAPLFECCCSILCQDPVDLRKRAQELGEDQESINIGNSDVVDRLARSEDSEETIENVTSTDDGVELGKDALLDWLSRTEVNDVLWALALHGSSNTTSGDDEVTLSETVATLREIAFDRIIEWLEEDLGHVEKKESEAIPIPTETAPQEKPVTVEVVDAAALLASAQTQEAAAQALPVESMTLRPTEGEDGVLQEVEVVDAAALLASMENAESNSVETEATQTSALPESGGDHGVETTANTEGYVFVPPVASTSPAQSSQQLFSPHDLASIAWSVTELHDPLRLHILSMVVKLVAMLGENGTVSLAGADLANLAWAIARYESESSESRSHIPSSLSSSVSRWIIHSSLELVQEYRPDSEISESNALDVFEPPEIGRLLWAVACSISNYVQVPECVVEDTEVSILARIALITAASNLSLFATEDLLRIGWAFMEICGSDSASFDATVALSLGRLLSTVEESLYRWERGDCNTHISTEGSSTSTSGDASPFSSFFGISRMNQPVAEQLLGDHEDEDEIELTSLVVKKRRPLLRDLSVDPSTLCRAACALERLVEHHPQIKCGGKLTEVAIRLLVSKEARLLKQCSIHDIVRLSEAAVRADTHWNNRQLVTGLFAHKIVYVLNEVLDDGNEQRHESSISFDAASPTEVSTLIWSLANLGVKHVVDDDARNAAYKKLRLVTERRLLTREQVSKLDISSQIRLLQGLIYMKYFSSDPGFILTVVEEVSKNEASRSTAELCTLAESIGLLKEALKADVSVASKDSDSREETEDQPANPEDENDSDFDSTISVVKKLSQFSDKLLLSIADHSKDRLQEFTANELRRLLSVYALLPFEAESLIESISDEILARKSALSKKSPSAVDELVDNAMSTSLSVKNELFKKSSSSPLSALKNGIMTLFWSSESSEPEESSIKEELANLIESSINSTIQAASEFKELGETMQLPLGSLAAQDVEGSLFELGRCEELIASYRRIEFSTGSMRSRYDKTRRREISKRVLSRLLP